MKDSENKPLANTKRYQYSKALSTVILGYVAVLALAVLIYAVMNFIFDFTQLEFIAATVFFIISISILLYIFYVKVFVPLTNIEKAVMILEKGNYDFEINLNKKNDIYPLSIQLNAMLKNLKDSMNREYTAGILKKQAEINALQSQINPHFLYNVLDSIRGHALTEGVDEIAEMTEALSILFRYSISSKSNLVTLESELKNIKNYFKIQQYRFNNKFDLDIKIEGNLDKILSYKIPKLTIQPILENSIYHGLEMKMEKGKISIRVQATEDRLIINISDDGVGMDRHQLEKLNEKLSSQLDVEKDINTSKKTGIALTNVNQRIKLLFGEAYGLYIYSTPNIGTDVEIIIPKVEDY
ncbi:MAG: sensor histidine kinase [Clostridia bacterium]|nr:sensor histidine kinase [Clostridia bacterium]